VDNLEHSFRLG